MGMFDYIKYDGPLPDGTTGAGRTFQTKDMDAMFLETYIIGERLTKDEGHYDTVPKAERPYPNAPKGSLTEMCGCMRFVVDRPAVDLNYHGDVNFYDDKGDYTARFTDGRLTGIVHHAKQP